VFRFSTVEVFVFDASTTMRPSNYWGARLLPKMIIDETTLRGLSAVRVLRAKALSRNDMMGARAFATAKNWPVGGSKVIEYFTKAAVPTISSDSAPLLSAVGADMMTALRPQTIVGRLNMSRLPTRTRLLTQQTGFTAHWFAEGRPVPMSSGSYAQQTLDGRKVGCIVVASNEMLRSDSVDIEAGILQDLLAACAEAADRSLVDPANAGVAGQTPAAITHPSSGGVLVPSTGNTVASIDTDLKAAAAALLATGAGLESARWVLSPQLALKLSLLRGTSGVPSYPGMSMVGGLLAGLPAVVSAGAPSNIIALIDPRQVGFSEDEPDLATSQQAAVDMSSQPGAVKMSTPISLFQAEATALMCVLRLDFIARRAAAATITGITL
jgi:hypothetical protein